MKKKDLAVSSAVNFVFIILSCLFARIFSNMAVKLADLFVALSFISASGVRAVTLFLFSVGLMAFFAYMNGYHTVCYERVETAASAALAAVLHFVLAALTVFSPVISGATKHIGGFLAFGDGYTKSDYMKLIPFPTLVVVGFVTALIYAAALVLATYIGTKKRLKDRAELTGENAEAEN